MVATVESAVMWVKEPVAGLCRSGVSGSQEEAGALVGLALGLFVDVVEVVLNSGDHSRWLACWFDRLWVLCRMWCLWTVIAGNNHVGIIVVFIICKDLEGVVVPCQTLVQDG